MGRLTAMPGRLAPAKRRLGPAEGDTRARDRERARLKPWRRWYGLKRWKDLAKATFRRAGYTCEQTGVPLVGKGNDPDAPVCDHKRPHRGDPTLFWDPDNLQAVSKAWHDSEKQRQERAGLR